MCGRFAALLIKELVLCDKNFITFQEVCHMNRKDICKNIIQSIKEYITNPDKLEAHRAKNHFVRKRKLSIYQVIMYLIYSSKASMFNNLSHIRKDLGNLAFPNISKQALSKARQYIRPSLFKEIYYLSVDLFYQNVSSRKLWHDYHLCLMRLKENYKIAKKCSGDILTVLPRDPQEGTEDITVRVIQVTP